MGERSLGGSKVNVGQCVTLRRAGLVIMIKMGKPRPGWEAWSGSGHVMNTRQGHHYWGTFWLFGATPLG